MQFCQELVKGARRVALIFVSPTGRIEAWSPGADQLFGYSAAEAVGQDYGMLFASEQAEGGHAADLLRRGEQQDVLETRASMQRKGGTRFYCDVAIAPVRSDAGELSGFTLTCHDASEQQRLAAALERVTEELHQFAFVVSHDLQEPTRTIRSYSELLQRRFGDKLEGDAKEFLDFMTDAANRTTQLLKDLLAYSQAGRPDRTKPEATQVLSILQWALMNVDPMIKETKAKVTYGELPLISVDQTQFASVLQHLLTNSMKFRGDEPPVIHIQAEADGPIYRFSVRDNGIGIDPQFHERVFGVFKRLHGKDVPGTGIGLAICRKVVEAHGGTIWLDSSTGKGTTVYFTLPNGQ